MTAVVWSSALIERRYSLTSGTDRFPILAGRQTQGRAGAIRLQIEEIIRRGEENRGVISLAVVSFGPEVLVGLDVGVVAPGDVIRNEIDQGFHSMMVNPIEQAFEFIQPFGRIFCVIGADIEVIFDCIRAAGQALE